MSRKRLSRLAVLLVPLTLVVGLIVLPRAFHDGPSVIGIAASETTTDAGRQASVVLRSDPDSNGVTWRAVTSDSSEGRCLDVEAVSSWTGEPLGRMGGCGLTGVGFDSSHGFHSAGGDHVLLTVIGHLRTTLPTESVLHTVVFGVASCTCTVRVTLSDGVIVSDRSGRGLFLARVPRATEVRRIEAVDDAGRVLEAETIPVLSPSDPRYKELFG